MTSVTIKRSSAVGTENNNQRDYGITWVATFFFFVAYYALIVPLPRYLTGIGLADWQVGFVLGATSIAALITRPISGVLTDRFGYKRMLLFGGGFGCTLCGTDCYHRNIQLMPLIQPA